MTMMMRVVVMMKKKDDAPSDSKVPKNLQDILNASKLHNKASKWNKPDERNFRPLKEAYDDLKENSKEDQFPQFTRFCSILDFRADSEKEDNLFVFEPED